MDPYVYPGTTVLRNLRDIRESNLFQEFEAEATARRLRQLEHNPFRGDFNTQHLRDIHHHIFQDVFDWAGTFRTVNISKSGDTFAFTEHIVASLDRVFADLLRERRLIGMRLRRFGERAAYYLGEINAIHPFREGNGRAQREFIRELAAQSGWVINWTVISRQQMIDASRRSLRIDNSALTEALWAALDNNRNRRGS